MKNNSFTAERIAAMRSVEKEICQRLGYTHEDIANMMYENGVAFLTEYFKAIPEMGRMMERDRMFWNWWKNEWHIRNVVFINDAEIAQCGLCLQQHAYAANNNGIALTQCIKPTRVVYCGVLPTLKRAS